MKDPHEKGVAIHSAPSFALGTARCTAKRKQGNRWAGYGVFQNAQSGRRRCRTERKATRPWAVARVPGRSCVVVDPRHA